MGLSFAGEPVTTSARPMKTLDLSFNLNLNRSLFASVILHGSFLVGSLFLMEPASIPLPVGVELKYGDGGEVQAPQIEENSAKSATRPLLQQEDTEAPSVKQEEKPTAEQVLPTEVAKTAGSLAGTSDKGALTGRSGVVGGVEVSPEERYLYEIKTLLERRKRYPLLARKMGQSGKVTMRFTLAADGSVMESEVVERAPYDSLNKAAQDLVQGIHGLKPFPQEITRTTWSITVPIEYMLN
ncbi:MAG: TonB family protein [Bdellovibrio sp.]